MQGILFLMYRVAIYIFVYEDTFILGRRHINHNIIKSYTAIQMFGVGNVMF